MPKLQNGGQILPFDNSMMLMRDFATTRGVSGPRLSNHQVGSVSTAGSRSVNPRSVAGRYKMNLMNSMARDDLNSSLTHNGGSPHLFKSASVSSVGRTGTEDKFQRSQVNIDKKMREDFDRIQNQLKKRSEKDAAAQEQLRYQLEERVQKANLLNSKG